MKRKEEAMEALKTELDSAQQERHAKVWSNASSCSCICTTVPVTVFILYRRCL